MMKDWIKLLRVKHYIKNLLVFLPMFFDGAIFDGKKLIQTGLGFICFCLLSSAIYILNDCRDMEKDRNHPTKKNRPLASGKIRPRAAIAVMAICLVIVALISAGIGSIKGAFCLLLYLVLNVLYSMGLKNKPIIDIAILASGFVIRVFYGGSITGVVISNWLFLVITAGSLYMGLGKRRNELRAKRYKKIQEQFWNTITKLF